MDKLATFFNFPDATLRRAQQADIKLLVPLINEAYSYQDEAKGEPRTNPDHLRTRMAKTDFYVIEFKGHLAGCVYLEPRAQALHFGLLTLAPDYRGKGLGNAVMSCIEAFARNNKYVCLDLDYMSLAPWLKGYYERYGFVETGETAQWGKIELVRMRKLLA